MPTLVIDDFIRQFKSKHSQDDVEVVAILGFGSSFKNNSIANNSDVDVYVVIKNSGKRYRGVMFVGDIEVDYFVYPLEQFKADWERVKGKIFTKQTVAYMLRDGEIILDKDDELKKLKDEAGAFLKTELANDFPGALLVLNKYFVTDYLNDIKDAVRDRDLFSWQYNTSLLLTNLIEMFCQFHKIPLVKPKYQSSEIGKRDTEFVRLYESIADASSVLETNERVEKLALYCLESLGGKLPKEWELERSVDVTISK